MRPPAPLPLAAPHHRRSGGLKAALARVLPEILLVLAATALAYGLRIVAFLQ